MSWPQTRLKVPNVTIFLLSLALAKNVKPRFRPIFDPIQILGKSFCVNMRSIAVEAFVIRVGIMILLWSSCLAPAQPQHEVIVTEGGEVIIKVSQATPYYLLAKLLKGKKTIKTPKPNYLGTQCEPRPKSPGFLGSLAFK